MSSQTLQDGTVFAGYSILRELGRGGMATVYLAEDDKHHRQVALKILKPEIATSVEADRFLREIGVTATLTHPNILPLYDSGRDGCQPYFTMPYVDGGSLRERLDREPRLPVEEAVQIIGDVASALGYAHERGVVHRDVKPENIFLKGGVAKLGDFGLAERPGCAAGISGTAGYIAPEVADGQQGFAGDVFAFACTAWSCLTGEPAFGDPPPSADSSAAVLVLVERAREGQVLETDSDVPAAILAALRSAMQPEPERRPSLAELLDRLAALRPIGKARRWRRIWTQWSSTLRTSQGRLE